MHVWPAAKQQAAHGREMYFGVSLHIYSQHFGSFLQETVLHLFAFRWVRAKRVPVLEIHDTGF